MAEVLLITLLSVWFCLRRSLHYLSFMQQDEYRTTRLWRWIFLRGAFDRKGTLTALGVSGLVALGVPATYPVAAGLFLAIALEKSPTKHAKLPLKMTKRAKRLYVLSVTLYLLAAIAVAFIVPSVRWLWAAQAILFQAVPLFLTMAAICLMPWEWQSRRHYIKEAKAILDEVDPLVIGITGSYGKTSTKEILGQVLRVAKGPTFWPPKGVNTDMGIVRHIREDMTPHTEYAVVEMAAYGRGSIERLCCLTPPKAGLITNIGTAHLERFGTVENIYQTKTELARAVDEDGILVCNGDNAGARRAAEENPKKVTLLFGFDHTKGHLDCWISSWHTCPTGVNYSLHYRDREYYCYSPLFGQPNLYNIMGAFTMACALGCDPDYVVATLHTLEPVDNRLKVTKSDEITYLMDAYNSNPFGFSAALDTMQSVQGERRIVVTPGMVELGKKQFEENERIGTHVASVCDLAIVVGKTNRKALKSGLEKGGMGPERMLFFDTRDHALAELKTKTQAGDVVLIENDLPDLYEKKILF